MSIKKPPIRLLLAETKQDHQRAIARAVRSEPQIVIDEVAASGYEAITKTLRLSPHVVLMNCFMETTMAGIFACKEICANDKDVKVILYGDAPADSIVYKAFQMGAVNFIKGDVSDRTLVDAVVDAYNETVSIHYSTASVMRDEFKRFLDLQDNMVYALNAIIKLTPAELGILKQVYNGLHPNEIAKILFISISTMKSHISHILKKFNLENMNQVVTSLRLVKLFNIINISPDYDKLP